MSTTDTDLWRETIACTDLGDGLSHLHITWRGRDDSGAIVDLGDGDAYALCIEGEEQPIEIGIDRNAADWYRQVHLLWPDGTVCISNTARQLVQLGELLRRPAVAEAVAAWAAEDAAADAASAAWLAERQAGQEGGRS